VGLKVHPELWTVAKVQAQPKRGIGADTPPIADDLGDPVRRDTDGLCKLVPREGHIRPGILLSAFSPGVTGANSVPAIIVPPQW
jgi:hypothetical protein